MKKKNRGCCLFYFCFCLKRKKKNDSQKLSPESDDNDSNLKVVSEECIKSVKATKRTPENLVTHSTKDESEISYSDLTSSCVESASSSSSFRNEDKVDALETGSSMSGLTVEESKTEKDASTFTTCSLSSECSEKSTISHETSSKISKNLKTILSAQTSLTKLQTSSSKSFLRPLKFSIQDSNETSELTNPFEFSFETCCFGFQSVKEIRTDSGQVWQDSRSLEKKLDYCIGSSYDNLKLTDINDLRQASTALNSGIICTSPKQRVPGFTCNSFEVFRPEVDKSSSSEESYNKSNHSSNFTPKSVEIGFHEFSEIPAGLEGKINKPNKHIYFEKNEDETEKPKKPKSYEELVSRHIFAKCLKPVKANVQTAQVSAQVSAQNVKIVPKEKKDETTKPAVEIEVQRMNNITVTIYDKTPDNTPPAEASLKTSTSIASDDNIIPATVMRYKSSATTIQPVSNDQLSTPGCSVPAYNNLFKSQLSRYKQAMCSVIQESIVTKQPVSSVVNSNNKILNNFEDDQFITLVFGNTTIVLPCELAYNIFKGIWTFFQRNCSTLLALESKRTSDVISRALAFYENNPMSISLFKSESRHRCLESIRPNIHEVQFLFRTFSSLFSNQQSSKLFLTQPFSTSSIKSASNEPSKAFESALKQFSQSSQDRQELVFSAQPSPQQILVSQWRNKETKTKLNQHHSPSAELKEKNTFPTHFDVSSKILKFTVEICSNSVTKTFETTKEFESSVYSSHQKTFNLVQDSETLETTSEKSRNDVDLESLEYLSCVSEEYKSLEDSDGENNCSQIFSENAAPLTLQKRNNEISHAEIFTEAKCSMKVADERSCLLVRQNPLRSSKSEDDLSTYSFFSTKTLPSSSYSDVSIKKDDIPTQEVFKSIDRSFTKLGSNSLPENLMIHDYNLINPKEL